MMRPCARGKYLAYVYNGPPAYILARLSSHHPSSVIFSTSLTFRPRVPDQHHQWVSMRDSAQRGGSIVLLRQGIPPTPAPPSHTVCVTLGEGTHSLLQQGRRQSHLHTHDHRPAPPWLLQLYHQHEMRLSAIGGHCPCELCWDAHTRTPSARRRGRGRTWPTVHTNRITGVCATIRGI